MRLCTRKENWGTLGCIAKQKFENFPKKQIVKFLTKLQFFKNFHVYKHYMSNTLNELSWIHIILIKNRDGLL